MINADDFYGRDAFIKAYNFLVNADSNSNNYGMIGYMVSNTLTENGSVKRGVCEVDENDYLKSIIESKVERINNVIVAKPLDGRGEFNVDDNATVSMNFLLFTPSIFKHIEDRFPIFLEENKDNLLTSEYLIPDVLEKLIQENKVTTKVINTTASWYGVTYKEDTPSVRSAIKNLVDNGEYNYNLWK